MARVDAARVPAHTAMPGMSMVCLAVKLSVPATVSARVSVSLPRSQIDVFCTRVKMSPARLSKMVDTISNATTSQSKLGQRSNDTMVAPDDAKIAVRTATKLSPTSGRVKRHARANPNARATASQLKAAIDVFCILSKRQGRRTFPMVAKITSASTSLGTPRS